jgi:uncharacterized protein YraI
MKGDNAMVFARSVAIAVMSAALSAICATAKPVTTTGDTNLRKAPGTDGEKIGLIPNGTKVEVGKCGNGWCEVTWKGKAGYALARNLAMASVSPPAVAPAVQSSATKPVVSPQTGALSPSAATITFDRNKVSHDVVVAAVSSVFLVHGYKSSANQESVHRVQEGQPAKQLDSGGPIRFIDTELQPPLGGSGSQENTKPWRYKALINDDNVELRVYVKVDPVQFMGIVFDEAQATLQPPDMQVIVQELRTKLQ